MWVCVNCVEFYIFASSFWAICFRESWKLLVRRMSNNKEYRNTWMLCIICCLKFFFGRWWLNLETPVFVWEWWVEPESEIENCFENFQSWQELYWILFWNYKCRRVWKQFKCDKMFQSRFGVGKIELVPPLKIIKRKRRCANSPWIVTSLGVVRCRILSGQLLKRNRQLISQSIDQSFTSIVLMLTKYDEEKLLQLMREMKINLFTKAWWNLWWFVPFSYVSR